SSLNDCEKTGECEAPPSCDPESGTCEPGTGGATAIVDPSTGGGTGIVGSGGSTIGGPGGGTNDGGTGGAVIKPECMPQSEICNGEDDDCNGAVDEGCPSTFAWENEIEEEAVGDG